MMESGWLEDVMLQIRLGLRRLRRDPGFTLVAVITLALGIGANTAIFSVVQGVVLAPLPYRAPDRLVAVWQNNLQLGHVVAVSYPDFLDWQRSAHSFQQMAAFTRQSVDLTGPGTPEHINGKEISSGFFSTLGTELSLGREFSHEEDQHGGTPVVIISNRLWRNRFAASPTALGQSVTLNGVDYSIVGVLPPGFRFGAQLADVYTALGQGDPLVRNDRTGRAILPIARLRPGASIAQAQAEMSTVQENLDHLYPDADRGLGTEVVPLKEVIVGDIGGTILFLFGAVALVLLIACANVANLLMMRSAARTREFAIRSALGANRSHIVRQLTIEGTLLSLAAAALGLAIAKWGVSLMLAVLPGSLPRSENVGVNAPVLLFTFAISIAVGILFGLAPALKRSNIELQPALNEGGRGSTSAHHRGQSSLVIFQMALTLVLLVAAGLLFRTIRHLSEVNPGFDTQHVITFKIDLSPSVTTTPSRMRVAYQRLIERIRELPGVQAADFTMLVPLSGQDEDVPFWTGPQKVESSAGAARMLMFITGPDYIRAMGIPIIQGRFFSPEDTSNSAPVIVVDSVLAQTYFAGKNPVGQTVTFDPVGTCQIIGVVGHVKHWGLGGPTIFTQSQAYFPFYQIPDPWMPVMHTLTTAVVRTPLDSVTLMAEIREAVSAASSDQPVYDVETMQEMVSESMSSQRFPMILLGAFAGLALLLASVGVYGVISYSASRRTHEIGIRMALGAEKQKIFRMVIGQGLRLAFTGLALGVVAALILTRLLSSFSHLLFGVGTSDPLTFALAALVLTGVTILACYVPARRATTTDPMVVLRYE
jgi:predicted permease